MPILNYTTKISVFKTVGEIQELLVRHGARAIMQEYNNDGSIASISFCIDTAAGKRNVRLPANADAVMAVLKNQKVNCDKAQAERVAWRIIKDWTAAQMAILESQMVQMDEIFLPYMVNGNGQTFFQAYQSNQLALGGGEEI